MVTMVVSLSPIQQPGRTCLVEGGQCPRKVPGSLQTSDLKAKDENRSAVCSKSPTSGSFALEILPVLWQLGLGNLRLANFRICKTTVGYVQ